MASEDHVRQKHVVVLTGGHDKNERRREIAGNGGGKSGSETSEGSLTLGAKGYLPSGHIVSLLWVLKQFAQQIPTGQIMGSFKKYPPQYPVGTL